jgi:hypothetical protein
MRQFTPRAGLWIILAVLMTSLSPHFVRSALAPEDWAVVQNRAQGYKLYRPPGAQVMWYTPEGILHIELPPNAQVLTVRVYENPDRLSAETWTDANLLNMKLKAASELVPMVPTIEREKVIVAGQPAETWVVVGPVRSYRRVVVPGGDTMYVIDHPVGEAYQESVFRTMVSTFETGRMFQDLGINRVESVTDVNIPPLPVPYYSQTDSRWVCDQIGSCYCYMGNCVGYTGIGDAGCYIASEAMVYEYYTGHFMDPQELDTCLTQNGGYTYWLGCGYGLCATSYMPLPQCSPATVSYESFSSNRTLLDEDLQNGFPVIAWIDGGAHYAVIVGKQDGKYQILDPLYARTEIYSGEIIHFVRYHGPLPSESSGQSDVQPGFPVQAYRSGTVPPAGGIQPTTITNLDGEPTLEIIVSAHAAGLLYAWNADSSLVVGWPPEDEYGAAYPAAGVLTGTTRAPALAAGYDGGLLVAYSQEGLPLPGWPQASGAPNGPPALADVDGDGLEEIFVGLEDQGLFAFHPDGTMLAGWPVHGAPGAKLFSPALADLDGDADLEVITAAEADAGVVELFVFHHTGLVAAGFPVSFPGLQATYPMVGDVDGDGALEIVAIGKDGAVYVFSAAGLLERTLTAASGLTAVTAPALADLDGDQIPEVIVQADRSLNVWKGDGSVLAGWPEAWGSDYRPGGSAPVVGDVDGDQLPDVVITLEFVDGGGSGEVRVFNHQAEMHPAFPKVLALGTGSMPAVADIDLDGRNEIVLAGASIGLATGFEDKIWVYDLGGEAHGPVEWGQFGGGSQHRGLYPVPGAPYLPALTPPAGPGVYLPLVRLNDYQPLPALHGRLTWQGAAAAGETVVLRLLDGGRWSDLASTMTNGEGSYVFGGLPALDDHQRYEVAYTNISGAPDRVASWISRPVPSYALGADVGISNFDLSGISLLAPPESAEITLPAAFTWSPRTVSPGDYYALVLLEPGGTAPVYQGPLQRNADQFILAALPPGLDWTTPYLWSIWIYSPDGALAQPTVFRTVSFLALP